MPQAIIYPLELIRTRLAVSPVGSYTGISHCFAQVLRHEGWRSFYRGMLPSMVRLRLSVWDALLMGWSHPHASRHVTVCAVTVGFCSAECHLSSSRLTGAFKALSWTGLCT